MTTTLSRRLRLAPNENGPKRMSNGDFACEKVRTASAMIAEDGSVGASARALWVAMRNQWAVRAFSRFAW
jgi:hypothetical protein